MDTSYAVGRAGVVNQGDLTMVAHNWVPNSTKRGCVACHFSGGSALSFIGVQTGGLTYFDKPTAIAEAGIPIISGDEDGTPAAQGAGMGCDNSAATVGTLASYVQSAPPNGLGCKTDKILLWGASMGGLTSLNYARLNPTKVAAIALAVPALDIQYVYNNWPTEAPFIAEAAGGAGNLSTWFPVHNPIAFASSGALAGIPIKIWYSESDPGTPEATVRSFAGQVNAAGGNVTLVNMGLLTGGIPAGHDSAPAAASDVASFLSTFA